MIRSMTGAYHKWQQAEESNSMPYSDTHRFRGGLGPMPDSLAKAAGSGHDPHALRHASASNRARSPDRFTCQAERVGIEPAPLRAIGFQGRVSAFAALFPFSTGPFDKIPFKPTTDVAAPLISSVSLLRFHSFSTLTNGGNGCSRRNSSKFSHFTRVCPHSQHEFARGILPNQVTPPASPSNRCPHSRHR